MPALPNRRQLLQGSLATLCTPALARADTGLATDRRFVFVYALGGWDPTRVFCPEQLTASAVSTEVDAEEAASGDLRWVRHPQRPAVDGFFERWSSQTAVLNGINVASIAHGSATRMLLTGSISATDADWPTRIGAASADDFIIPSLITGGPAFMGDSGVHVGRAGFANQLHNLATGEVLQDNALPSGIPPESSQRLVDAYLTAVAERRAATAQPRAAATYDSYALALERAQALRDISQTVDLEGGSSFSEQCQLAVRALEAGVCRVATVNHPDTRTIIDWDSHNDNDASQSALFEELFTGLDELVGLLDTTEADGGGSLLEHTIIVVLSEMGRTPWINTLGGKEHWPFTSAMLLGAGVRGGQTIGGYDDELYARPLVLETGEPDADGEPVTTTVLGATLLALAGVAAPEMDAEPITALLE